MKNFLPAFVETCDNSFDEEETPWQKIIDNFKERVSTPQSWEFSNKIIHYKNPNPILFEEPSLIVEIHTPKPQLKVLIPGNPCRIDSYSRYGYQHHESLQGLNTIEFEKRVKFYQETEFTNNQPLPLMSTLPIPDLPEITFKLARPQRMENIHFQLKEIEQALFLLEKTQQKKSIEDDIFLFDNAIDIFDSLTQFEKQKNILMLEFKSVEEEGAEASQYLSLLTKRFIDKGENTLSVDEFKNKHIKETVFPFGKERTAFLEVLKTVDAFKDFKQLQSYEAFKKKVGMALDKIQCKIKQILEIEDKKVLSLEPEMEVLNESPIFNEPIKTKASENENPSEDKGPKKRKTNEVPSYFFRKKITENPVRLSLEQEKNDLPQTNSTSPTSPLKKK